MLLESSILLLDSSILFSESNDLVFGIWILDFDIIVRDLLFWESGTWNLRSRHSQYGSPGYAYLQNRDRAFRFWRAGILAPGSGVGVQIRSLGSDS